MNRMTLAAAVALATLAAPVAGRAQGALSTGPGSVPSTPPKQAPADRPDALPGAKAANDRITPAERSTADMEPTEELFDSINRGDIATARDAISRGADLQGQNLLGMSPLELSVDLGRNDITFLILSYRGVEGAMHGRPPPATSADAGKPAHPMTRAERRRAAQEAARAARSGAASADAAPSAGTPAKATRTPTQYASDGGTPVPSAGFLGFDNGRH